MRLKGSNALVFDWKSHWCNHFVWLLITLKIETFVDDLAKFRGRCMLLWSLRFQAPGVKPAPSPHPQSGHVPVNQTT